MASSDDQGDASVADPIQKTRTPRRFKVILHNDNYTTMEFVIEVLVGVFNKSTDDAVQIMFNVHHQGYGMAGVYPKDIAETKVATVDSMAQSEGFPLRCSAEPE